MPRKLDETFRSRKKNLFGSPYEFRESIHWLLKNTFGWKKRINKNIDVSSLLPEGITMINNDIQPELCIAAVGDIMDMHDRELLISEPLKQFLNESDYLLGNFEATITNLRSSMTAQRHSESIVEFFKQNFKPDNIILSLANNHAADYSREIFDSSISILKNAKIHIFGYDHKHAYIDISDEIRIITGSIWSNMEQNFLPDLSDIGKIEKKKFNLLYPHWGYELEHYPRNETIVSAADYLKNQNIDAIIGHHSHCPQPISIETINRHNRPLRTIIAYSLGDFCTGLKQKYYQYGLAVKIWIGKFKGTDVMGVHKIDWKFIECKPSNKNKFEIRFSSDFRFLHQKREQ